MTSAINCCDIISLPYTVGAQHYEIASTGRLPNGMEVTWMRRVSDGVMAILLWAPLMNYLVLAIIYVATPRLTQQRVTTPPPELQGPHSTPITLMIHRTGDGSALDRETPSPPGEYEQVDAEPDKLNDNGHIEQPQNVVEPHGS